MRTLEQELEIALSAETSRPDPAFAERLDQRVEAGFPRGRRRRPRLTARRLLPALAAAAVLMGVIVAIAQPNGSDHQRVSIGSHPGSDTTLAAPSAQGPATAGGSARRGSSSATVAPARPRRVQREAELTLGAPRSRLQDVADQVVSVVDRHHGFVLHSEVTSGSSAGASFDLRVPSGQLQPTLADLSGLADVRSRTQQNDDITAPYNATADALAEARALRQSLLGRLAAATTQPEIDALRQRIRLTSARIRVLSNSFARLRQRAGLASIAVTLVPQRAHKGAAAGGIGGDFHDALHSLAVSVGIALRVLGVLIPLAIVAALGSAAALVLRRRRREAALS